MFFKCIVCIFGVIFGIFFFLIFILEVKKIIDNFLRSYYLRKEILALPKCRKLLDSKPIKIIDGLIFGEQGWAVLIKIDPKKGKILNSKILTTIETIKKNISKGEDTVLFGLAHEIGHIEIDSLANMPDCSRKDCIVSEWLAWEKGIKILNQLNIDIDFQEYWQYAFISLTTYYEDEEVMKCLLSCPLKEEVEKYIKELENDLKIPIPEIFKTFNAVL